MLANEAGTDEGWAKFCRAKSPFQTQIPGTYLVGATRFYIAAAAMPGAKTTRRVTLVTDEMNGLSRVLFGAETEAVGRAKPAARKLTVARGDRGSP
jgi:hypothetical protein